MAKTLANLLGDIVKRAKISPEDKKTIKTALENTEVSTIEIDQEDYDSIMENLHNIDTAENILKPKIKAETLNGVDAQILEILGEGLDDIDLDTIKTEKITASKLRKGLEAQRKKIESKLGKSGGDGETEKALRKEIKEVNEALKLVKEKAEQEKAEIITNHKKSLFDSRLNSLLTTRTDIADDFKTSRHFAENFKADLNEFFAKNKIEVDYETSKLLNKDTKTPFMTKSNDEVELTWAIDNVVKEYKYEKKSNTPEKVEIEIDRKTIGTPDYLLSAIKNINAKQ